MCGGGAGKSAVVRVIVMVVVLRSLCLVAGRRKKFGLVQGDGRPSASYGAVGRAKAAPNLLRTRQHPRRRTQAAGIAFPVGTAPQVRARLRGAAAAFAHPTLPAPQARP